MAWASFVAARVVFRGVADGRPDKGSHGCRHAFAHGADDGEFELGGNAQYVDGVVKQAQDGRADEDPGDRPLAPDDPPGPAIYAGLPMPERVWDE